jgi:hypothetical protein
MNVIQEVIELWSRGEVEAATLLIDGEASLLKIMKDEGLDHADLVEYLKERNAGR